MTESFAEFLYRAWRGDVDTEKKEIDVLMPDPIQAVVLIEKHPDCDLWLSGFRTKVFSERHSMSPDRRSLIQFTSEKAAILHACVLIQYYLGVHQAFAGLAGFAVVPYAVIERMHGCIIEFMNDVHKGAPCEE